VFVGDCGSFLPKLFEKQWIIFSHVDFFTFCFFSQFHSQKLSGALQSWQTKKLKKLKLEAKLQQITQKRKNDGASLRTF